MKEETKNEKCVNEILSVLKKYNRSPSQVRYIFKRVREKGKYQVPKEKKQLPDYMNDAEIGAILDLSSKKDETTSLLIPLGIFTGLRISELSNLKIQEIDFENYQIKVIGGKGGKDRYIPINNVIIRYIKGYINDRKKGYLFVKSNQTPYSKRALQKKVEKLLKELSLDKKLSSHSLRHTYATLLRRRGMSLERIQVLLGHSRRTTTEIYAKMELEPVKEDYFKMIGF